MEEEEGRKETAGRARSGEQEEEEEKEGVEVSKRRNLQKYIAAQEAGSNRVSSPCAARSALSSSDFTAFSGWRSVFPRDASN